MRFWTLESDLPHRLFVLFCLLLMSVIVPFILLLFLFCCRTSFGSLLHWNAFYVLAFSILSLSYNPQFGGRILTRGFPRDFAASPANAANHCVVNTSRAAWWLWVIVFLILITLYREIVCRTIVKTLSSLPPAFCSILTSFASSFSPLLSISGVACSFLSASPFATMKNLFS